MSDVDLPLPIRTELTARQTDCLQQGVLSYQKCSHCGHAWLPARTECPSCLHDQWQWVPSGGRGKVVSWVVFHMAYHKAFESRLPYNVAIIELEEGPRLISNVVGLADPNGLHIDQRVTLRIEQEGEFSVPRFVAG